MSALKAIAWCLAWLALLLTGILLITATLAAGFGPEWEERCERSFDQGYYVGVVVVVCLWLAGKVKP